MSETERKDIELDIKKEWNLIKLLVKSVLYCFMFGLITIIILRIVGVI